PRELLRLPSRLPPRLRHRCLAAGRGPTSPRTRPVALSGVSTSHTLVCKHGRHEVAAMAKKATWGIALALAMGPALLSSCSPSREGAADRGTGGDGDPNDTHDGGSSTADGSGPELPDDPTPTSCHELS